MLKDHLKLAWRNLVRNRIASLINIIGLSVGLATSIILILWIAHEYGMDSFHTNLHAIHRLMLNQQRGGDIHTGDNVCGPLGPLLRQEIPELKYVVRTTSESSQLIRAGDKSLYEEGIYAEPDYFNMMTFPALTGHPAAALQDAGSVVITETTAHKLFGNENPMGKVIVHDNIHTLKVAAVIRDVPENSTVRFGIVLPFSLFEKEHDWVGHWDYNALAVWMQTKPGVSTAGLNKKLKDLLKQHDQAQEELFAYPLTKRYLYSEFKNGQPQGGKIILIVLLGAIGLFVLVIACINFMNLTTARSEYRAREVGVRKTLGASRPRIIIQFLTEAMLMTFIALFLSISFVSWFLPVFRQLTGTRLSFDISNFFTWGSILAIGLCTGLIAGSYPALFLSSFKPVKVLKGVIGARKGGAFIRKALVTFQFVISIFLITGTIVLYLQVKHVEHRPIGYDLTNLIDIPARGDMSGKFSLVKNELLKIPGVTTVSGGTDNLTRFGGQTDGIQWPGKTPDQNFLVFISWVQYDWVKTAGLHLAEGRDFNPIYGTDTNACLLNQAAVKKMGLKAPVVGTKLGNTTVIGVIDDFVFNNPTRAFQPIMINLSRGNMDHFFVRLQNDASWRENLDRIGQALKKVDPNYPFEFHFVREEYEKKMEDGRSAGLLLNIAGGFAIFISCMGLFGLSAFLTERRTKEIGIRKVLGASVSRIWFLLTREFLAPVLLACLITFPLAILALHAMLQQMDYRITLAWWMFAAGGLLSILIALATVSLQGIKAAVENPVKSLRTE
ncbi:MAG: ABC transporter permease [Chitinophagaceae bacterium]|nr:ABC transporter permease [Chitinophagaceae bacterium]